MSWYRRLWNFWRDNLEQNILRISIGIGAFLMYGLTLIPLDPVWKGSIIILASLVIMSIFGKNGNGKNDKQD